MAVPNMIVTLLANTTGYAKGLQKAVGQTNSFGRLASASFKMVGGALLALGVAVARFIPDLIKLGVESRQADIRLKYVAQNMVGLGRATEATVKRLSKYADTVQQQTGIDDEQIKAIQAKILLFKGLAKTADEVGGTFDRVTMAALDMAAIGFGAAETNAVKLARLLQNPIANLNILNRLGVVFTDQEKRKATAIDQTNGKIAASNYVLGLVEQRVKGLAEKTANPLDIIGGQFQNIAEQVAVKLLPAIDNVATAIVKWVNSPGGTKSLEDMANAVGRLVGYFTSEKGLKDLETWASVLGGIADTVTTIARGWDFIVKSLGLYNNNNGPGAYGTGANNPGSNGYNRGGGIPAPHQGTTDNRPPAGARMAGKASLVVNFNAPVDSVSAGREIKRVLDDYHRANGGR